MTSKDKHLAVLEEVARVLRQAGLHDHRHRQRARRRGPTACVAALQDEPPTATRPAPLR